MEGGLMDNLAKNKKAIAVVIGVLIVLMLVVAYYQKWWFFADKKKAAVDDKKSDEKEGFYEPGVLDAAQDFLDEGDMNNLLSREAQGYLESSKLENEIMPARDEVGYDGNWAGWIAHEGAEPGVHLSHQQYIRELGPQTRGVSNQSVMDHVVDSNFRGIDRPPQPHRVKVHDGVREVASDYVHQHPHVGITRQNCDKDGYFGRFRV